MVDHLPIWGHSDDAASDISCRTTKLEMAMKGEIFVEFINLVEDQFGLEVADRIIEESDLDSGGVYTRVGTYDHGEMVRMVRALSLITSVELEDLQRAFGKFLFERLVGAHRHYVEGLDDSFALLSRIEDTIHVNVRKLYPDATLPTITVDDHGDGSLEVVYASDAGFGHVCHGLIEGCVEYFQDPIEIQRIDVSSGALDQSARFLLTRAS
jgi:hypothetical protein